MKWKLLILAVLTSFYLKAQPGSELGNDILDHLDLNKSSVLSKNGLAEGNKELKSFVNDFNLSYGENTVYEKSYSIEVNQTLSFEIGEVKTSEASHAVMFLKRKDDPEKPFIEFLVIYEQVGANEETEALNSQRSKWMELCNAHDARELVKQLYTSDTYYYNRGRLLQGTVSLSKEYSYMNNPNYTLRLTPKHITFVTSKIAYEIGQCSGSYSLPYMLLWEKQDNGDWQVLMDSNY